MSRRFSLPGRADLLAAAALAATAVWWVWEALGLIDRGLPSHDIYGAHYPNMLYALRALRTGEGLLWNPFQNCGQPFLPSTLVGLFFPSNALFLFLPPDAAYPAAAGLAQLVGGAGMYLLCRAYGAGAGAALAGALAFQLGAALETMSLWLPTTIAGPFALTPWALWCGERLMRTAGGRAAAALAVVLALQGLAGYPQLVLFTGQLLALRLLWCWGRRELAAPGRTLALFAAAVAGSICLAAVQWLPAIEFARQSLRGAGLSRAEIMLPYIPDWPVFRRMVRERDTLGVTFSAVGAGLALLGLTHARLRRVAAFYLLAAGLFTALAFDGPLQRLYFALPGGQLFREPYRFLWPAGMCWSVLTGLGVAAIQRHAEGGGRGRAATIAATLAGLAGFAALAGGLPPRLEIGLALGLAVLVVAAAAARGAPGLAGALALLLPALVLANSLSAQLLQRSGLTFASGGAFQRRAPLWRQLAMLTTADARMYSLGRQFDYSLQDKSAQVMGVPSISDYEPQTSRRFANLEVMLLTDGPMRSINQYYFRLSRAPKNRRLMDLLATRWLVLDPTSATLPPAVRAGLRLAFTHDRFEVFENAQALPRARWVPAARIVSDPDALLAELAHGPGDPRREVLLEAPPADGFLGAEAPPGGDARVIADHAETVTVAVQAPAAGFLVLADQDYAGWRATVNGAPVPILRANYAFRAVRVPAGRSTVVFTYRPWSVYVGAALSLASLTALAALLRATRRQRVAA